MWLWQGLEEPLEAKGVQLPSSLEGPDWPALWVWGLADASICGS